MPLLAIHDRPIQCVTPAMPMITVSPHAHAIIERDLPRDGRCDVSHVPLLDRLRSRSEDADLAVLINAIQRDGRVYVRWI